MTFILFTLINQTWCSQSLLKDYLSFINNSHNKHLFFILISLILFLFPSTHLASSILSLNIGWNSLAGAGLQYTYHSSSPYSLNIGAGYALYGLKTGIRVHYLFNQKKIRPFIGLGANYFYSNHQTHHEWGSIGEEFYYSYTYKQRSYAGVQFVAGLEYVHHIFVRLSMGYHQSLVHPIYAHISGPLYSQDKKWLSFLHGSAPIIEFSLGMAL